MKNILGFLFLLLFCKIPTGFSQWQQLKSFDGGAVTSLCMIDDKTLLAGTKTAGIYISRNASETWDPASADFFKSNISGLFYYNKTIYACINGEGIFKSVDIGKTWSLLSNEFKNKELKHFLVKGASMFLSTGLGGIYKSFDSGKTWKEIRIPAIDYDVNCLLKTDSTLIAAVDVAGVYVSFNDGDEWFEASDGIQNKNVLSLVQFQKKIYAGTKGGGVFYTDDGCRNWKDCNQGLQAKNIRQLSVFNNSLMVGTQAGVYNYDLMLNTWIPISEKLNKSRVNAFLLNSKSKYFVADVSGILRSGLSKDDWSAANAGIYAHQVNHLISFQNQLYIYANYASWITKDKGVTFEPQNYSPSFIGFSKEMGRLFPFRAVQLGAKKPANTDTVVYDIYDKGMKFMVETRTAVFAGTYEGVYVSYDKGNEWYPSVTGLKGKDVAAMVKLDSLVFVAIDKVIYYTDNQGKSWQLSTEAKDYKLNKLISLGDKVFAATNKGLLYTANGKQWANAGLFDGQANISDVKADDKGNIFVSTYNMGIYKATLAQFNWQSFSDKLPRKEIMCMEWMNDILYAGTAGSGIFWIQLTQ